MSKQCLIHNASDCPFCNPEEEKKAVSSSAGLARLVRLKPQITELEHGAEPSIRELIFNYYADHDMESPEQLTSFYLSELEKMAGSGSSDAGGDGKMDICQDEGCPNYVIDEPNNCITFKQVSECPTPDYLNSNKAPGAEVPCSDRAIKHGG